MSETNPAAIEARSSRARVLTVRLSEDEANAVRENARLPGLNISAYLRVAVLALNGRLERESVAGGAGPRGNPLPGPTFSSV
ncbi:MAG: hypothetical protein HY720_08105 [Planctomycetes bacterium]|nr:hypothetical protein [Planctomycetota bacterium]